MSTLLAISAVIAAPSQYAGCDISAASMPMPANQTQLTLPSGALSFIALGVGVQNYTCSSAGNYTNIGAVAEVFDISCLYGTPAFHSIQNTAYDVWDKAPPSMTAQSVISMLSDLPVKMWDFTSAAYAGNAAAYAVGAKTGDMVSPDGAVDVDWLQLKVVKGALASTVYRMNTVAGQLPGSCSPGDTTVQSVKYTSKYYFFGGSIKQ
ncbi:putative malate dehydrogenase [Heliocybe sulcata]|uniref:Putative malate dehydrogenase n=1 Tax=Heliocybe sulcata TaxID=5364 RepID=A0A5C3MVB9_9AGAM|nr:putative malate dehydrogenase [Heliocybe sulcata]